MLTPKGVRDLFVLVLLHVETRGVFITPATCQPSEAWMQEQARAFVRRLRQHRPPADIVMHDRDTKFAAS